MKNFLIKRSRKHEKNLTFLNCTPHGGCTRAVSLDIFRGDVRGDAKWELIPLPYPDWLSTWESV